MEQVVAHSDGLRRVMFVLLGIFAVAAILLFAIGLFGVMAYSVSQRLREVAIRMALGAPKREVLWMVIRRGMRLAMFGIVIGVALSLGCSQVMARLLYEVNPTDPMTFACVVCLLLAVTGLACWVPARRAAGVDPMRALRNE
jgi:putative ABC transport system permease protein